MNFTFGLTKLFKSKQTLAPQKTPYEQGYAGTPADACSAYQTTDSRVAELVIDGAKQALREGRSENFAAIIDSLPSCETRYLPYTDPPKPSVYVAREYKTARWMHDLTANDIRRTLEDIAPKKRQDILDEALLYVLQPRNMDREKLPAIGVLLKAGANANCKNGAPLRVCALYGLLDKKEGIALLEAKASVKLALDNAVNGALDAKNNEDRRRDMEDYSHDRRTMDRLQERREKEAVIIARTLRDFTAVQTPPKQPRMRLEF